MRASVRIISHLQGGLIYRFAKFGTVGASGVLVNLSMVYAGQEWLFRFIASRSWRLNASLGLAIFLATLNNFFWNWAWTWKDRKHCPNPRPMQFGQYLLACGFGITVQVIATQVLAGYWHYLLANLTAIVMASLANFVANDRLTFQPARASRV